MKKRRFLITGGTGFIGKQLIEQIAPEAEEILLFVRRMSLFQAKKTFRHYENVRIIEANLLEPNRCGIHDPEILDLLVNGVTDVVHAAALYDLNASAKDLYLHSLLITQNFVKFCNDFKELKVFHHLSSYAVNISEKGEVSEDDLALNPNSNEPYSWSKNRSEWVIQNELDPRILRRIYRPGIVIGHSETGEIEKWDGPYYLLGTLNEMKKKIGNLPFLLPLPFEEAATLPLIPVNELVNRLKVLILSPNREHLSRTYHLLPENPLSFSGLVQWLCLKLKLNATLVRIPPRLLPKRLEAKAYEVLKLPHSTGNFLRLSQHFRTDQLRADFPGLVYHHRLSTSQTPWLEKAMAHQKESEAHS
jgi:thioester reductase-like protein